MKTPTPILDVPQSLSIVTQAQAEDESGARVDARSVSRVGTSDLGANAARLEAFSENLRSSVTG